jgi:DNA-binding transcriptional MerR regulator
LRPASVYRIDDLAREAKTTVRNVRAYQDRGLLPPPRKQGRVALYDDRHLARLRHIGDLLQRGYTLASMKELLEAGVLGLVAEVTGPWGDERPERATLEELAERFGPELDQAVLDQALRFGLVEADGSTFRVPSPRLLAVGAELLAVGVPVDGAFEHLALLRADMERIATRFVKLTAEHVLRKNEAPAMTELVKRLKPLAQVAVDAELARAMRNEATRVARARLKTHARTVAGAPAHRRVREPTQ